MIGRSMQHNHFDISLHEIDRTSNDAEQISVTPQSVFFLGKAQSELFSQRKTTADYLQSKSYINDRASVPKGDYKGEQFEANNRIDKTPAYRRGVYRTTFYYQ